MKNNKRFVVWVEMSSFLIMAFVASLSQSCWQPDFWPVKGHDCSLVAVRETALQVRMAAILVSQVHSAWLFPDGTAEPVCYDIAAAALFEARTITRFLSFSHFISF